MAQRSKASVAGKRKRRRASAPIEPPEVEERDGKVWVADVSPLRDLSASEREKRLLGILEVAAVKGLDPQSARDALNYYRWKHEMKHGRPGSGSRGGGVEVTIVDDVSAIPAEEAVKLWTRVRHGKE